MIRSLLGIWTWLAFAVVSALGFCICAVVFLFTVPFDKTRKWTGKGIRLVGRTMIRSVPIWRFRYEPPAPSPLPDRLICVSNHCSNLDPFLVAHVPWEMKYLAKETLFRIPFVGWGIGLAGDIPVKRGSTRSIREALSKATRYIRQGMPVFFFPEGTRSKTGELLPFKDGAFRLAIEEQAHILPLAVGGTLQALRKGDWRPRPADGIVIAGELISTEGLTLADVPALKEQTRQAVLALREKLTARGFS